MLIALSLISAILTFLFSFFVQSAKIENKLDNVRMYVAKRGYLQTRLQNILISIDRSSSNSCFYTKQLDKEGQESLIIQFDNGIDPDPAFSGPILGRIYLDEKKNLNLATWPLSKEKNRPWRNEILFPKVQAFSFEFLGAVQGKKERMRLITPNLAWHSEWPKSLGTTPTIIRLTLFEEGNKEPVRYAFILPTPELITYREAI